MKKNVFAVLGTFIALNLLISCSGKKEPSGAALTVIRAVTENTYPPFSYVDENGKATGYDVEVVRAIGEKLKSQGYDLQVEAIDGAAALMAFNSHTADIFFDEMDITAEREEVYYFSIPYYKVASNIIVKKDRNDINSLRDLEGKTLGQSQGSNWWVFIENYNKTTAKTPIILVHNGTTIEQTLLAVQYGQFDARIDNPVTATGIINRNKLDLKILPDPVMGENIGLMFAKDENGLRLKNLIDPIIRELERDGTLSRLALEYTGYPYNP